MLFMPLIVYCNFNILLCAEPRNVPYWVALPTKILKFHMSLSFIWVFRCQHNHYTHLVSTNMADSQTTTMEAPKSDYQSQIEQIRREKRIKHRMETWFPSFVERYRPLFDPKRIAALRIQKFVNKRLFHEVINMDKYQVHAVPGTYRMRVKMNDSNVVPPDPIQKSKYIDEHELEHMQMQEYAEFSDDLDFDEKGEMDESRPHLSNLPARFFPLRGPTDSTPSLGTIMGNLMRGQQQSYAFTNPNMVSQINSYVTQHQQNNRTTTYRPASLATYGPASLATYGPASLATYGPASLATYGPASLATGSTLNRRSSAKARKRESRRHNSHGSSQGYGQGQGHVLGSNLPTSSGYPKTRSKSNEDFGGPRIKLSPNSHRRLFQERNMNEAIQRSLAENYPTTSASDEIVLDESDYNINKAIIESISANDSSVTEGNEQQNKEVISDLDYDEELSQAISQSLHQFDDNELPNLEPINNSTQVGSDNNDVPTTNGIADASFVKEEGGEEGFYVMIDLRVYGPDPYQPIYVVDTPYYLNQNQIDRVTAVWNKVNPESENGSKYHADLEYYKSLSIDSHK